MPDAAYDDLEARIAVLREAEELASIRPDLDGAQIMAELVMKPGPVVGETYRFLLDLRMERGRSVRSRRGRRCAPGGPCAERGDGGGSRPKGSTRTVLQPLNRCFAYLRCTAWR